MTGQGDAWSLLSLYPSVDSMIVKCTAGKLPEEQEEVYEKTARATTPALPAATKIIRITARCLVVIFGATCLYGPGGISE